MTTIILPIWTTPDGGTTGPLNYPPARTDAEVDRLVRLGLDEGRRARGSDVRVRIVDDVTGRCVAVVRAK